MLKILCKLRLLQVIQCGYCDRTFKQDGRYKEHLKNKHANEDLEQAQLINLHGTSSVLESVGDVVNISTQGPSQSSYPVKTPKSLLHEWCQKNKKPAPRFKHVSCCLFRHEVMNHLCKFLRQKISNTKLIYVYEFVLN